MSQALTIRFATDVEGAKKGMADLAGSIAGNMAKISTSMLAAGRNVDSGLIATVARTTAGIGALQIALAGGALAGFAILGSAVEQANEQLDRYIKLGEKAEKAGVNVEFFQKFIGSAGDAKDSVDALEKALNKAGTEAKEKFEEVSNTRKLLSNLFQTGFTGDFQSQGLRQFDQAATAENRIKATLVAMRELQDLGLNLAAIKVGETMFGADFAERLRQGKVDIAEMIDKLDQARGRDIITAEDVQRASDLRDRIEKAKDEIAAAIGFSFSLAGAGTAVLNVWAGILETVVRAVNAMKSWTAPSPQAIEALGRQQADNDQRRRNRSAALDMMPGMGSRADQEAESRARSDTQRRSFRESETAFRNTQPLGQEVLAPFPNRRPLDLILNPLKDNKAKGGGSAPTESLDKVESFINQLERARDVAKAELDNINKSNVVRAQAVELAKAEAAARSANRSLTDEERSKILSLAEAQQVLKDKILDVKQAQAAAAETVRYFGNQASDALGSLIFDGAKASDVLNNLAKTLGKASLQALLTGQGPLASLFGTAPAASAGGNAVGGLFSLFAGGFKAGGGDVRAGRAYTVGELGTELFVPKSDGTVMPMRRGGTGGSGNGLVFNSQQTNNIMPAQGVTPAQLQAVIAGENAKLAGRIASIQKRAY